MSEDKKANSATFFESLRSSTFMRVLYEGSLKFSSFRVKVPTRYGLLNVYFYSGGLGYIFGRPFESRLLRAIQRYHGKVVINIGANIGWYTLIASKLVGDAGRVVAVEAEPNNFRMLLRNIHDRKLTNVTAINVALTNRKGTSIMYISNSPARHSLIYTDRGTRTQVINTSTLDTIVRESDLSNVDLLIIDTEGAEFQIFEGGNNFLAQTKAKIIVESEPNYEEKLSEALEHYGYTSVTNIDGVNYLCCKE